jgi:3-hydroxybutyryl-CoA dehydrogenase
MLHARKPAPRAARHIMQSPLQARPDMSSDSSFEQAVRAGATAAVVGCGAMGRGIAQCLAQAELRVLLFDAQTGAADAAKATIGADLEKLVTRGKLEANAAAAITARLQPVNALADLAPATFVIEAVIEDLEIKRLLFTQLEQIVAPDAILATNTSSLSVTALAAVCKRPERVVGYHFFNPAPVMKVVEVVAALRTDPRACEALANLTQRFGHTPVRALDTPGFIVNHAGRGYGTEGMRILAEGICEPATLDAVLRDACAFKLGPCELLDLTGLDVSHPVMESIYHQYYEEPRFRPQVLTQRMLEGGLFGRKRSAGFYRYADGQQQRPAEPAPPSVAPPRVWIASHTLRVALAPAVQLDAGAKPGSDSLIVVAPIGTDTTAAIDAGGFDARRTVGYDVVFPGRKVQCLFANPGLASEWRERARAAFAAPGVSVHLVRDSTGLIGQRVVAHIVNIACAMAEQRIAVPGDIDRAVQLGLGYPHGPLAWGDAVGAPTVRRILDGLLQSTGDPRYRASTWLTRRATLGLSLTLAD